MKFNADTTNVVGDADCTGGGAEETKGVTKNV